MPKSHVGMGCHVCPICMKEHTEVVLLQTHLGAPPRLTAHEFAGWDLCPEHEAMREEYLAFVECETPPPQHSSMHDQLRLAKRTGQVAHIRRSALDAIFNSPMPANLPMVWAEKGMIEKIQKQTVRSENGDEQRQV